MILVARCLERVGDNAVEIAEQVVFVVTGLFREMAELGTSAESARNS
jgi:phosphate transport system protein